MDFTTQRRSNGLSLNHHTDTETETCLTASLKTTESNNEKGSNSFIANGIIHQNSLGNSWNHLNHSNGITINGIKANNIGKRNGLKQPTTTIVVTKQNISNKNNSKNSGQKVVNDVHTTATTTTIVQDQSVRVKSESTKIQTEKSKATTNHHAVVQNSAKFDINSQRKFQESYEPCSYFEAFFTYFCYGVLVIVGYINGMIRPRKGHTERKRTGYGQLYASFESFYTHHVYRRVRDGWNIPICSVPGKYVTLVERISPDFGWTFEYSGKTIECINMGSYNYLGFAENQGKCAQDAIAIVHKQGICSASTRKELGNAHYLDTLDKLVARFVGTEDAITCSMGFATNSMNLPCILNKGCLVISDEKNHASIILGLRTSGATIRVFKHNNMKSLEKRLREGIIKGRPKTNLPWDKIFIVVEGVYSMEGSIVRLPEVVDLKRKYKAYIYLDEAHSIGAVGPRGRGVCDYWGVNPKDVDILMGTFTKSFGSAGGYIAGSRQFIQMLRATSHAHAYGGAMSAPVAEQILTSMKIIMGEDGSNEGVRRIHQLARNSRYFRQKLKQLGFVVYGNDDSPVVPVALYMPTKITYTVREMIKRGVALVGVGFPATPLVEGRIRFCMSASHTKEMLDHVLKEFSDIGDLINTKTSRLPRYQGEIIYKEA